MSLNNRSKSIPWATLHSKLIFRKPAACIGMFVSPRFKRNLDWAEFEFLWFFWGFNLRGPRWMGWAEAATAVLPSRRRNNETSGSRSLCRATVWTISPARQRGTATATYPRRRRCRFHSMFLSSAAESIIDYDGTHGSHQTGRQWRRRAVSVNALHLVAITTQPSFHRWRRRLFCIVDFKSENPLQIRVQRYLPFNSFCCSLIFSPTIVFIQWQLGPCFYFFVSFWPVCLT